MKKVQKADGQSKKKGTDWRRSGFAWILTALFLFLCNVTAWTGVVQAEGEETAGGDMEAVDGVVPSTSILLMEASTGKVIKEQDADVCRPPASVTKVMTLLLTFEKLSQGKIHLTDEVTTSARAKSMGGSQVFLEEGEIQTVETLIKCIAVASGNDASVAVAEHIAGSEEEFVKLMNEKADRLGMKNTHFVDCCGLTDSTEHYTTARDVALMSRELITKYPDIFNYTTIWMEDITHTTAKGSSNFTLSSTNKLLKQYQWANGLKTGFTSRAKYCITATACKDEIELIAVIMGAETKEIRNQTAIELFNYGYSVSNLYLDANQDTLEPVLVEGGVEDTVSVYIEEPFRYLDIDGNDLSQIEKTLQLPEKVTAPVEEGGVAGRVVYRLGDQEIGSVCVLYGNPVEQAFYLDYLKKTIHTFFL